MNFAVFAFLPLTSTPSPTHSLSLFIFRLAVEFAPPLRSHVVHVPNSVHLFGQRCCTSKKRSQTKACDTRTIRDAEGQSITRIDSISIFRFRFETRSAFSVCVCRCRCEPKSANSRHDDGDCSQFRVNTLSEREREMLFGSP